MSSIHETSDGIVSFTKGAPKEVLSLCKKIEINGEVKELTTEIRDEIIRSNDDYAKRALRVLAVASRDLTNYKGEYAIDDIEKDLVFLGLAAMIDPPRAEVETAVAECFKAGIKII